MVFPRRQLAGLAQSESATNSLSSGAGGHPCPHFELRAIAGYSPGVRSMRINFDPIQATHLELSTVFGVIMTVQSCAIGRHGTIPCGIMPLGETFVCPTVVMLIG